MNPIYRHSFVNAFLAGGAISNTTGNINGNNTNFFYTRTFVPVANVYPRKLYQNYTPQAGGAFYNSNKEFIGGWGSNPTATNTEFDIPNNAAYIRFNVSKAQYANGTAWLRLGTLTAANVLAGYICKPIYKDDLAKEYELETNQRFYRAKLSGKISFVRDDYDYINTQQFDNEFLYCIEKSDDGGRTWLQYFQGKFMKTDCTFVDYDKKVTVQPDAIDDYNDVLAGLEKEYNLISLAPTIQRLTINKRPLIQIYVPGDSIVSCFLGGTNWEQDADVTTDRNALINTYHFALCNLLKEINVTGSSTPNVNELYVGRMSVSGTNQFTGNLYPKTSNGYYIRASQQYDPPFWGVITYEIVRSADSVVLFSFLTASQPFDNVEFDFTAVSGSGSSGSPHAEMATYSIYARYLCDVEKINSLNTYPLPADDIVDDNRNYRRAIGYAIDVAFISNNFSTTPTEWGLADNGQYFAPPYSIYGQTYYPIARSTWRYASLWFGFYIMDWILEEKARKQYTLRDTFPLSSVLSVLLNQIAPGITHAATAEYSQFLYGSYNPISGLIFRLFVSQKTNIINGEYQQPAQKAPTTLQQFTNMLRDCFKCYWFIEDGKFKIEHIQYFRNGGSYTGGAILSHDLTKEINLRNGKPWAFNTSEYSFDKVDLPERFQFQWMDDVTTAFQGLPIEVQSKYVTAGKVEDVNVSNFTSDIDLMLLNPGNMSSDGFALFAAVQPSGNIQTTGNTAGSFINASGNPATNANFHYMRFEIEYIGTYLISSGVGGSTTLLYVHYYDASGNWLGSQYPVSTPAGGSNTITDQPLTLPAGTAYILVNANNANTPVLKISNAQYQLPFTRQTVNGVDYYLQNGYLAFINLQPSYWVYDLPARSVLINGSSVYAYGIERKKKQTFSFPANDDPNPMQLIKTYIGNGQVDKLSVNLCSRSIKTTLKYDTE